MPFDIPFDSHASFISHMFCFLFCCDCECVLSWLACPTKFSSMHTVIATNSVCNQHIVYTNTLNARPSQWNYYCSTRHLFGGNLFKPFSFFCRRCRRRCRLLGIRRLFLIKFVNMDWHVNMERACNLIYIAHLCVVGAFFILKLRVKSEPVPNACYMLD